MSEEAKNSKQHQPRFIFEKQTKKVTSQSPDGSTGRQSERYSHWMRDVDVLVGARVKS